MRDGTHTLARLAGGVLVVSAVQLPPGITLCGEDLVAIGRERLGGYEYPPEVQVRDARPHTPVDKLDRKTLRERL